MRNRTRVRVDLWPVTGRAGRWYRPIMFGLTVAIGAVAVAFLWATSNGAMGTSGARVDYTHYLDATRRWLDTGTPYLAAEAAGPFDYQPLTYLHPPIALLLFLPFLWLPAFLWWAIPLSIVGACVVSFRPAPWSWPILALLLCHPYLDYRIILGNSGLWIWAGIAAGLRFGWPALLVIAKPSLAPFVLVGARHRSWWIGAIIVAIACLPFGALWLDWFRVVVNSPGDWTYNLVDIPWLMVPVVAWLVRRSDHRSAAMVEIPNIGR